MTQSSRIDELLKARQTVDEEIRRYLAEISVLFTDLVGSTSYLEQYGDLGGLGMVTRHAELATEASVECQGRVVASASGNKTIRLWEVSSGRKLKTLTGYVFGLSALAASRDGRWLASSAGESAIRLHRRE